MRRLLSILTITLTSCIVFPKLSNNAFYHIDDTSIRLVVKHDKDSLVRTNYEVTYNLPGHSCTNLSTTDKLDTSQRTGVAIRFWTSIVMNDKHTAFYGEYAKRGLLDKIENIEISLVNGVNRMEIAQKLRGDTSTTAFIFRKYDAKKSSYGYRMTNANCLYNPYFTDIDAWKETLNQKPHILKDVFRYDFMFWLDRQTLSGLTFKPETLEVKITLVDSTGLKRRQLTDWTKIN